MFRGGRDAAPTGILAATKDVAFAGNIPAAAADELSFTRFGLPPGRMALQVSAGYRMDRGARLGTSVALSSTGCACVILVVRTRIYTRVTVVFMGDSINRDSMVDHFEVA
jgi:hypothetical protein